MKYLAFSLLALFAVSVTAQPKEPAKAAAPAAAAPAKAEAKPMPVKQAAGPKKPRRWNEDARHCLELTSNTEIIKCAEEFL